MKSGLVPLDSEDASQVAAAARLQAELLPESVPAQLGPGFMASFYFRKLVESRLLICDLYRHEGEWAALNTYTERPDSLLREGARRHLPSLLLATAGSLARRPARLATIAEMLRKGRHVAGGPQERSGYWLALAVAAPFRGARLEDGGRIATRVTEHMLEHFRKRGFRRVLGRVRRDNMAAILFHRSCGFRVASSPHVGDDEYELSLELE